MAAHRLARQVHVSQVCLSWRMLEIFAQLCGYIRLVQAVLYKLVFAEILMNIGTLPLVQEEEYLVVDLFGVVSSLNVNSHDRPTWKEAISTEVSKEGKILCFLRRITDPKWGNVGVRVIDMVEKS